MTKEFQTALKAYQEKIGERLEETLAHLPADERALLIALVPETIQSLHHAIYQGPDRLGAIKLVLQMAGLLKEKPKVK